MQTIEIHETTDATDRQKGIRDLIIEITGAGPPDTRHLISIMAIAREDIALEGEAPLFENMPDVLLSNIDLARALTFAAHQLLTRPSLRTLAHA